MHPLSSDNYHNNKSFLEHLNKPRLVKNYKDNALKSFKYHTSNSKGLLSIFSDLRLG